MRVLHVTESYGAGVATAIEQYMAFPNVEHWLLARIRPETDPRRAVSSSRRTFVRSQRELATRWRQHLNQDFDVIHAHSSKAGVLVRVVKHPAASVVYSPHALAVSQRGAVGKAAFLVERTLARRTHAFAAVSSTEVDQITRVLGRTVGTLVRIPHFVLPADPPQLDQRENLVVAVGRLGFQKNPESVAFLPERLECAFGRATRFVWVGHGDVARQRLLESHGWEVTGWLPGKAVRRLLASSRVLIHPARYEGMPYAVVEALALGTPVLAANIPPMRELDPAFLYDSTPSMTQHLTALLRDESHWAEAANRSHRYAHRTFSVERQWRALNRLYGGLPSDY